jgi:hypothetical protein
VRCPAQAGEARVREVIGAGGFQSVRRATETLFNMVLEAVACVELNDITAFCKRVEAALPPGASYPEARGRKRIGCWVEYYDEQGSSPRWALPDRIATAKPKCYSWQNEFRLVFNLTDALSFENVSTRLMHQDNADAPGQ